MSSTEPDVPASSPDASPVPENGVSASSRGGGAIKQAERDWHDAFFNEYALVAYPESLVDFQRIFQLVELTPFSEGGWNWWADLRREALDSVGDVRGLRVLDYGCGFGKLGMYLSLCGAQVWGFDLSSPAIETANQVARRYGLTAQFEQMDAEDLRYADGSFDLIIGFGVLHHVIKYPRAGAQLFRVLAPGGRAIFHETLWDNPLINLARRFTSEHADAGDAPLTDKNIREFCRDFSQIRLEKRNLLYMLKRLAKLPYPDPGVPVRPRPFWQLMKTLDAQLLRFAPLRRYCGEVIIYLA
ncbi:MAG TPA: class I SAM-dependent methyltransferase [Candidatus Limnocylindrales bacterium]|nr:class I SAM-dependent methyltransferase [Candidatus Limnocylindrales bacterium]